MKKKNPNQLSIFDIMIDHTIYTKAWTFYNIYDFMNNIRRWNIS